MESSTKVQEKLQVAIEIADKLREKIDIFQMSLAGFIQLGDRGVVDMFPEEREKKKENKQL